METFPFPEALTTRAEKEAFLRNRTLEQQFLGLANALQKKEIEITYYFRVFGCEIEEVRLYTYNQCTFYSKENPVFDEIKQKYPNFFSEHKSYFIIGCTTTHFNSDVRRNLARQAIERELRFFKLKFNRDFILDNEKNCLQHNGATFWEDWSSIQFNQAITGADFDDKQLNDTPFHFLAEIEGQASSKFKNTEDLFIQARLFNNIAGFWHYLEVLLVDFPSSEIPCILSNVLLLDEKDNDKRNILSNFIGTFRFGFNCSKFGISLESLQAARKQLKIGQIPELLRNLNYPFIDHLLEMYDRILTVSDYQYAYKNYEMSLIETYAFRNSFMHQGISYPKLNEKLNYIMPYLLSRVRRILATEIKNQPQKSMREIIYDLMERGKANLVD